MEVKDIITICIAGWGAILSTIMAYHKYILEKRRIKIILTEMQWQACYKISVINIGNRPVTINEIGLVLSNQEPRIPSNYRFKESPKFPITLSAGGSPAEFYLTDDISNEIMINGAILDITVYDVEGNSYTKYTRKTQNEKFNRIE